MRRSTRTFSLVGLSLFCFSSLVQANDADALREQAGAIRQEAAAVSQRLEKESQNLLQAADRLEAAARAEKSQHKAPEFEARLKELNGRLNELRSLEQKLRDTKAPEEKLAEVRNQIAETERELISRAHQNAALVNLRAARKLVDEPQVMMKRMQHRADLAEHVRDGELKPPMMRAHVAHAEKIRPELRGQLEQLQAASRRIQHMRVAAENLKMAEMPDIAQKLLEKSAEMEQDVNAARQRLAAEMQSAGPQPGIHLHETLRELRGEIERLRGEVKELRRKVDQKDQKIEH